MDGMTRIGWKWVEISESCYKLLEWLEMAGNVWKWLYMPRMTGNPLKWLEMARNGWKLVERVEMARKYKKLLEMARYGWNGWIWMETAGLAGNGCKFAENCL